MSRRRRSPRTAPWPLLILTHVSGERIFIAQLAIFGGVFGALSLPALRLLLTPARLRRSNAHRAALEQLVAALDRNNSTHMDSLAYKFDIVLRGRRSTPFENKKEGN